MSTKTDDIFSSDDDDMFKPPPLPEEKCNNKQTDVTKSQLHHASKSNTVMLDGKADRIAPPDLFNDSDSEDDLFGSVTRKSDVINTLDSKDWDIDNSDYPTSKLGESDLKLENPVPKSAVPAQAYLFFEDDDNQAHHSSKVVPPISKGNTSSHLLFDDDEGKLSF